jgi:hypothetical protein
MWYLNGKVHREDGPVIEHGDKEWCLNWISYSQEG